MEKPDVTSIDGLSPAVAIQQSNPTRSSRSTVGTATEVYDYMRLLWARVGHAVCPACGRPIEPQTVQSVTSRVLELPAGTRVQIAFPLHFDRTMPPAALVEQLRARGFMRLVVGSAVLHIDDAADLDGGADEQVLVIADRLLAETAQRGRIAEAVQLAFAEGGGDCVVVAEPDPGGSASPLWLRFTERFRCAYDGTVLPQPVPTLFSFNSPRGACETCNGFGATLEYDERLIVPDQERTLTQGALDPWTKPRYGNKRRALAAFARSRGIDVNTPWRLLAAQQRHDLLNARGRGYKGVFPFLSDLEAKRYKQYIRVFLRQYQTAQTCAACQGARLRAEALAIRVAGRHIAQVAALSIAELRGWFDNLPLSASEAEISRHILREARARVHFLCDVGLEYITLDRATRTLSGGEAQRIALANSIGSQLVDALYVLDEPSIGLHSRDLDRLLSILIRLRDGGNTVLMVEHDLDAIRAADYMVELGPGSGELGGSVVFAGPVSSASASPLTGKYLDGRESIAVPELRRPATSRRIRVRGARENNLRNVDASIPLGTLTVVTGVSGSGKSTLVHDVLYRALELKLHGEHSAREHLGERVGAVDEITGFESIEDVVLVDQNPIGRSARSNPITYVKAFDEIRKLFAGAPLARRRRYTPGTFSFNVAGGRCQVCEGAGYLQVEMVFMADVFVVCEECGGRRFKAPVLEVTFNDRNIHEVLQLTVDQAIRFFPRQEKLGQALWQLQQVGLGYLRLGQSATTLSGGEAQRIKIARELAIASRRGGRKLYIMDEPSTGLHLDDIRKLARVLDRLVERGNTVLVIEHNLDIIKLADWVIDLGPEGGDGGGSVVAEGTPEEVAGAAGSHTGEWLRRVLPAWRDPTGSDVRPALRPLRTGVVGSANSGAIVENAGAEF
jgi:excinuclease ABC subunit A